MKFNPLVKLCNLSITQPISCTILELHSLVEPCYLSASLSPFLVVKGHPGHLRPAPWPQHFYPWVLLPLWPWAGGRGWGGEGVSSLCYTYSMSLYVLAACIKPTYSSTISSFSPGAAVVPSLGVAGSSTEGGFKLSSAVLPGLCYRHTHMQVITSHLITESFQ